MAIELIGGGTVENRGTIRGFANSSAIVVTGVASAATKIDNYGTIEASGDYDIAGRKVAAIYVASRADIINRSTGVIRGTNGADGIVVTNVANGDVGGTTITNEGLISSDSGNAISVYGAMRSITNSGTIISQTGTAIYLGANGSISDGITNSGTIQGGPNDGSGKAIDASLSSAPLTVINSGTIVGQVLFGSGNDELRLLGGSITGNVSGGAGTNTVNALSGTSTLNGSIAGFSAFTIASGAKVNQNGSIAATTVTNNGTLDVGSATRTITGNYVQSSTGTLAVTITDAAQGMLSVSGTASVDGKVAPNTSSRTTAIAPGASITVLESTGALTIAPTAGVDGSNAIEKFELSRSGNQLRITRETGIAPDSDVVKAIDTITKGGFASSRSPSVAATAAGLQTALTTLVNNFDATTNTTGLQRRITTLGTNNALGSILSILQNQSIAGGANLSSTEIAALLTNFLEETVPDFNISTTSAGVTNLIGSSSTTTISNRVASLRGVDSQTGMAAGDMVGRGIDMWALPYLSTFTQDKKDNYAGYEADSRGVTVGADTVIADNLRVGLAIGYANTDIDGKDSSVGDSSDIDSYQATLYASYNPAPWYVDVQLGYGFNKNDQVRKTSFTDAATGATSVENLTADIDSSSYRARIGGGLTKSIGGFDLTPNLFLQYVYSETDGYQESGVSGSRIASSDTSSFQGGIGLRIAYPLAIEGGRLIPELRVGYTREFNDDAPATTFAMVNLPELGLQTIRGPSRARTSTMSASA
ncbi:autotransporter outer membrane beta-barrel domain-containing protein [Skermanella pratensis]|uniref:autotransporter family protein n=1 Tax=Skermanella pratensis TaxID=2233999 RepID=UPI001787ADC1|nr:autotransporter outer membrane beta-barrel domain-containing protein [Skermanella pratensis]